MKVSTWVALLSLGVASAKTSVSTDYVFATKNNQQLRRQRRVKANNNDIKTPSEDFKMDEEDQVFWNRILNRELQSIPPPAPGPAPAPATPAPTPQSTPCPVTIDVDCVSVDGSEACTDIEARTDDCVVEVEYSYTLRNVGDEVERIYSLQITRGGETEDITSTFPVTDLQPGQSAIVIQNAEIDACQGIDAFETQAAFITGPPCDVQVAIGCVSEEGDECRELPQAETPADCLIDITYTYTVTNIGDVDANIILFTRTRNNQFLDLLPLLDDTALTVGESAAVEETEEIDRCVQQSFATNTIVAQLPNEDLLCEDVGSYP